MISYLSTYLSEIPIWSDSEKWISLYYYLKELQTKNSNKNKSLINPINLSKSILNGVWNVAGKKIVNKFINFGPVKKVENKKEFITLKEINFFMINIGLDFELSSSILLELAKK